MLTMRNLIIGEIQRSTVFSRAVPGDLLMLEYPLFVKGRCHGNQIICERQVQHGQKQAYFVKYFWIYWTYFRNLFTIWKLFMYRWWICTFFSKLVNFRPVISEFMLLKRAIFAAMHPQF